VAIVGISNWVLDSAKMNRAIHLNRPLPTVKDLHYTASKLLSEHGKHPILTPLLEQLAKAYDTLYHNPRIGKQDFYSLRDFYSFVKVFPPLLFGFTY
jgi:E3 ubiquitin-protein ligase RNF213